MGGLNLVGELYDYMIGIVVVGVIFTSAVFAIPAISYVNLRQVDQQQLRNTALNVFNTMLLGTGRPSDWGHMWPFNQSNVKNFGLASSEESSLYVLDTDKVQRLDQDSPLGYMEYQYVRDLLGLEDYGFCLTVFRPFTVKASINLSDEKPPRVEFAVDVTRSEDGRPIPNALVSATILVSAQNILNPKDDPIAVVTGTKIFFTNFLGKCGGNQTVNIDTKIYDPTTALVVLRITVAGITSVIVKQTDEENQNLLKINTFGDTVTLTFKGLSQKDAQGVRRVYDILTYNFEEIMPIYDGRDEPQTSQIINAGEKYDWWNMTFPGLSALDPALLLFVVRVPNPTRTVIVAGPFSFWESSKLLSYGPDSEQFSNVAIKLRRFVVISGITYIAELTLWKE